MKKMNALDKVVLNYYDCSLHESDIHLLDENNWLNDRLIGFVYEYFEKDLYKSELISRNLSLVNPSTVQYLKLCKSLDEANVCFLEPLELNKKEVVFLPLNNHQYTTAGGSHWSLLVVFPKQNGLFVHYDSTGGNFNEAKLFFNKYKTYFNSNSLIHGEFPKQTNSSDCGVYLIGNYFAY